MAEGESSHFEQMNMDARGREQQPRPTKALEGLSPFEAFCGKAPETTAESRA